MTMTKMLSSSSYPRYVGGAARLPRPDNRYRAVRAARAVCDGLDGAARSCRVHIDGVDRSARHRRQGVAAAPLFLRRSEGAAGEDEEQQRVCGEGREATQVHGFSGLEKGRERERGKKERSRLKSDFRLLESRQLSLAQMRLNPFSSSSFDPARRASSAPPARRSQLPGSPPSSLGRSPRSNPSSSIRLKPRRVSRPPLQTW